MTRVRHPIHGVGTLLLARDGIATVEFDGGSILKVAEPDVTPVVSETGGLERPTWDAALPTILKALALAVRSTNARWGVFSTSKVALLPHQLWVCHRVLGRWPARWLIADDVGLGKTIEAGLILTALLARGHVQRIMVLSPASLVEQWAERLRLLFDVRVARYHPEVDQPSDDFWKLHRQVVASMHTLRSNRNGRWERIFDAPPWDLVIVDEAHHLNADEQSGRTLGLKLLEEMNERQLIRGILLFTGTPHRGKDYGFLSLLRLLDDGIDPDASLAQVVDRLPCLMIRNNKQNVTDMEGRRLFAPPRVHDIVYEHSPEEAEFYARLTEFILTGRAYAAHSQLATQRSVMLVLTTLQKLAASSVSAVRRALSGRLSRLRQQLDTQPKAKRELDDIWLRLAEDQSLSTMGDDERTALEERIDELMDTVQLNPDEIPALEHLLALAERVENESRIARMMRLIDELPGESVLFFTEYKATQALVLGALLRHGTGAVGFINGDGYLDGVVGANGALPRQTSERRVEAARFNRGELRFLVSTEAAGEGIDLQESCHVLVHVDLPWNPMRMHQRVGRLNRYGQKHTVDVFLLRNPATVEGRIWECLESKLTRISHAFEGAMSDPEDIRELVLGLATPGFHERIATRALQQGRESFAAWYDAETTSFGGESVTTAVRALVGNTARFNYSTDAPDLPRVDLIDLLPFVRAALRWRSRRLDARDDGSFTFLTPAEWLGAHHSIRDRYQVHFDRARKEVSGGPTLLGAAHRLLEAALADAASTDALSTRADDIYAALWVFVCQDALSVPDSPVQQVVLGVWQDENSDHRTLVDWELVLALNQMLEHPDRAALKSPTNPPAQNLGAPLDAARTAAETALKTMDLPFARPSLRLEAVIWPASGKSRT